MTTTRRDFLARAGLITGAALLLKNDLLMAKPGHKPGLQLYSLRDQLPKDVKGVIAKVAKAGYGNVETFGYDRTDGYWGLSAKNFGRLLKDNGLVSASGHYGLNTFFGNGDDRELKMYIDVAHDLGQQYILVPSLPGEFLRTVDECKKVADQLNKVGEICKAAGLKTGYHNHNFEWKPVENTTFYDILLANTDPATVHMEMDIFWVVRAGHDPIEILRNHKGRFKFVHVKDRDKTNPNINTEIGSGSIDFKRIIPEAKKAGVEYLVVEQENFTNIDPFASIAQSAAYVKNNLL